MRRASLVAATFVLGACAMNTPATEVEVTEIVRGFHSPQTTELFELVTTPQRLTELWRMAQTSQRPAVAFDRHAVVAAFMGEKPTGGYAVVIERAVRRGDVLEVELALYEPGPGCMTTQAITQPFVFAAVPAGPTDARFTTRRIAEPCE
jgi:hypothetical protein